MPKTSYVCQQCRICRYPDCRYSFHPSPPEGVADRWRETADARDAGYEFRTVLVPLTEFLVSYRPSSYDPPWSWDDEVKELLFRDPNYLAGIVASVAEDGIKEPIQVCHNEGRVWDGHHRVAAAIFLGLPTVPIVDARYSDSGRLVDADA